MSVTVETPDELRGRAASLDERVEAMRDEARALACQAAAYRRRAIELEHEERRRVEDPLRRLNGSRELGEALLEVLDAIGEPTAMSTLVEVLGETDAKLRAVLETLIAGELVVRTGLKRGTRYRLAREGEEVEAPEPFGQRYEEVVRDAARRLGTFSTNELAECVPGLSRQTLYRWLAAWTERGVLEVERVGNQNVYAVVKPEALPNAPTTRPRHSPKPWEAPGGETVTGGRAVPGTGRLGAARRDVRDLLDTCRALGAEVNETKHGYSVILNGRVVTSVPKTASDHRSLLNARAALRRGGLDV